MIYDFDKIINETRLIRLSGSLSAGHVAGPGTTTLPLWVADWISLAPNLSSMPSMPGRTGSFSVTATLYRQIFIRRDGWLSEGSTGLSIRRTSWSPPGWSGHRHLASHPDSTRRRSHHPAAGLPSLHQHDRGQRSPGGQQPAVSNCRPLRHGFADLEVKAADPANTMMILCSPQPGRRVWIRRS